MPMQRSPPVTQRSTRMSIINAGRAIRDDERDNNAGRALRHDDERVRDDNAGRTSKMSIIDDADGRDLYDADGRDPYDDIDGRALRDDIDGRALRDDTDGPALHERLLQLREMMDELLLRPSLPPASRQALRPASRQASPPASRQALRPASRQASSPASRQALRPASPPRSPSPPMMDEISKELMRNIPRYDGNRNIQKLFEFSDHVDHFFSSTELTSDRKLALAVSKLTGDAMIWWRNP
jgi:hypothetical protein